MARETRSNALLMEIVLVVFFFLLSATVLMRLFYAVYEHSEGAEKLNEATVLTQNWLEKVRSSADAEGMLLGEGFGMENDAYHLDRAGELGIVIRLDEQPRPAGTMMSAKAQAMSGDEVIYELQVGWYEPDLNLFGTTSDNVEAVL